MPSGQKDIRLERFVAGVEDRNPGQPQYLQAVREVAEDILPLVTDDPDYARAEILRRIVEPDRVVSFRVVWQDDDGNTRVERGWRVQHSNAIGPYKGGLRFTGDLTEDTLKFLAFEQTFKNSLTGLPLGGGKGGATFNPKGKSDDEVMRFCQAFMTELYRHIGPDTDVPAGDIGVGAREIGYLFGQYKRVVNRFEGALTGKGLTYGGSAMRPEATGFGAVLFLQAMLGRRDEGLVGKTVAISGSGNVALHAAQKAVELGAKVLTLSDSSGFIHDPDGIDDEKLAWCKELKLEKRGRIGEYADEYPSASFDEDGRPWSVDCDIAMPCATQNELDADDASALVDGGTTVVVEGANMPCTPDAVAGFRHAGVAFGPAKAANAGGVAVSGLEMAQNSARLSWTNERLTDLLQETMTDIHGRCVAEGEVGEGRIDYLRGANIAGFRKVADAMLAYGLL